MRPTSLQFDYGASNVNETEADFFTKQARLQIEARMALAQAKDIAHMQMEVSDTEMHKNHKKSVNRLR